MTTLNYFLKEGVVWEWLSNAKKPIQGLKSSWLDFWDKILYCVLSNETPSGWVLSDIILNCSSKNESYYRIFPKFWFRGNYNQVTCNCRSISSEAQFGQIPTSNMALKQRHRTAEMMTKRHKVGLKLGQQQRKAQIQ